MFDLIIRQANLPDGQKGIDIAIAGAKIAAIAHRVDAEAHAEIDASSPRLSSTRISTWTPLCRLACPE
jgi:cytosine deaminase